MLKGLIVAAILLAAAFLFKVVPAAQQKNAGVALIIAGIAMMLTNLPYSWGALNQTDNADILFLTLLFGGAFSALVGVFLVRINREVGELVISDEVVSPFRSRWVISSIVGSTSAVILLFTLIVPDITAEPLEEPKLPPVMRQLNANDFELAPPSSVDEALAYLDSGSQDKRELAIEFVAVRENVDPEKRLAVFESLLKQPFGTLPVFEVWADAELVPLLEREFERSNGIDRFGFLLPLYSELVGKESALAILPKIENPFSENCLPVLKSIGPEATGWVVPFLNSSTLSQRIAARALCSEWEVDANILFAQCLKDLESADLYVSEAATELLLKNSGDVKENLRSDLAAAMEALLFNDDGRISKKSIVNLLGKYPGPNSSARLFKFLQESKKSIFDNTVLETILGLEGNAATDAALFAYFNARGQKKLSRDHLLKNGSESVVNRMIEQFDQISLGTKLDACKVIQQMEQGAPLLIAKCAEYLESGEVENVAAGMYLLSNMRFDKQQQPRVAAAIVKAIEGIDAATEDHSLVKKICASGKVWGDTTVATSLEKFRDSPNVSVVRACKSTIKKIQRREKAVQK